MGLSIELWQVICGCLHCAFWLCTNAAGGPRRQTATLKGGTWEYFKRRARRLIPPYYAALLLSLLIIALIPGMRRFGEQAWDYALPAFRPSSLIAHFLLLHDFSRNWIYKINPPLWSVAVEWHIYFFLPFVLVPLWRRFGLLAMLVTGVALGAAPALLLRDIYMPASPWFLGLFSMGAQQRQSSTFPLNRAILLFASAYAGIGLR